MSSTDSLHRKSVYNMQSARTLIADKYYSPSIHCSYYSCVQLILHIHRSHFNKSEAQVSKDAKAGTAIHNGYHNWLLADIYEKLAVESPEAAREFDVKIGPLSRNRVLADYKSYDFQLEKAVLMNVYASDALELLQKKFRT